MRKKTTDKDIKGTNDILSTDRPLRVKIDLHQDDVLTINQAIFSGVLHYGVIIKIPNTNKETIGWIPASLFTEYPHD